MAESLLPEIIPGMVAVEYIGKTNEETGEKKGFVKNVFPIDAKELVATGHYKLVDNGAVEAARLNANPLRNAAPKFVATEVTGVAGQLHVAADEGAVKEAAKAADHDGKDVPVKAPEPAKPAGTATGAKADEKK